MQSDESIAFFLIFLQNIQNLIWKKVENDSFWGGEALPH